MRDGLTFLSGVGIRHAGRRIRHPVSLERDGVTLTVEELVCSPDGTDLVYAFTDGTDGAACVVPGPSAGRLEAQDRIALRTAAMDDAQHIGAMATSVRAIRGGVRRIVHGKAVDAGAQVDLEISSAFYGDWRLTLGLDPFGDSDEDRVHPVEASIAHAGIAIRVLGLSSGPSATAVLFQASGDAPVAEIVGVGGLHDMRRGPTALQLRDERGRAYSERPLRQEPYRVAGAHVAVFEPLDAESHELDLEIPFVYLRESEGAATVAVPVTAPVAVDLGKRRISVLSTGEAPDSPRRRNFGPALAVALDLGGWRGDARVLFPTRVLVDGRDRGLGYGNGVNTTDPQPVATIEVRMPEPLEVKELTLVGTTVQIRGPWRVHFARP